MAAINVRELAGGPNWLFEVTVNEDAGSTSHRVSVPEADYERLTGRAVAPEELVRLSFAFLLEREPKESILREFEISVISRYFPDYEEELRGRVSE